MNTTEKNTLFIQRFLKVSLMCILTLSAVFGCGGSSTDANPLSGRANDADQNSNETTEDTENKENPTETPIQENQEVLDAPESNTWTILVYVMGDTDLEEFALTDFIEMAKVPTSKNLNIVALFDRSDFYSEEGLLNIADFSDTKIFQVKNGTLNIIKDQMGELNLGNPETLADFISYGFSKFPSERNGLILWDHGAGWPGMGPDDGNDFDILDLQEISDGIEKGLENAGIDKLDLIGFDACLMGTFEVAMAMAEYAEVMVASQEQIDTR